MEGLALRIETMAKLPSDDVILEAICKALEDGPHIEYMGFYFKFQNVEAVWQTSSFLPFLRGLAVGVDPNLNFRKYFAVHVDPQRFHKDPAEFFKYLKKKILRSIEREFT